MKICVPTETDSGGASRVFDHFGSAPYLAVIDTESGGIEVYPSTDCHGGDPDHHVGQLTTHHVETVACKTMGRRSFAAMRKAGIAVLLSDHDTVSQVLDAARGGGLRNLPEDRACQGGRRGHRRHRHGARD